MKKKNVLLVLLATFLVGCDAQQVSSSNLPSSDDSLVGSSNDILEVFTISTGGGDNNLTFSTQTASEGQVVTVTVASVPGKKFSKLECDVEGVTFTEVTPNKTYTFVMPSSNVTITAVYATLYSVTSFNSYDSSITGVSCEVGDQFAEGEEVTLSFALMSGSENSIQESISEFYVHINDIVVVPTFDTEMKATFVMPSENIDISVIRRSYGFEEAEEGGVQIICEGDLDYVKFLGFDSTKKYNYSSGAYICVALALGYKYTSVQYKIDDGDWVDGSFGYPYEGLYGVYLAPATSTFSIRVTGEYVGIKNITYVNAEGITSNFGKALPTSFMPGDNVSLYQFVLEDETKYIKSVTATTKDGTAFTEGSLGSNFSGSVSFEMPNEDLTITFEIAEKQKVSVVENDKISNVRITNGQMEETSYFQPGESINVRFSCESGFKVNKATLSLADSDPISVSGTSFSFSMPEGNEEIQITLTVVQIRSISYDLSELPSDTMSIRFNDSNYGAGDIVNGNISLNNVFYNITGFKDKNHSEWSTSLDGTSFEFVMPDYDLVLKPIFNEIQPQVVSLQEPSDNSILSVRVSGRDTRGNGLVYEKDGQNNVASANFLPKDTLSVTVAVQDSENKIPVIKFNEGEDTTQHLPQQTYPGYPEGKNYNFNGIVLPDGAKNIQIILIEKPTFTLKITNNTGIKLSYKVNNTSVSSLESVHLFDNVSILLGENIKGVYQFTAYDSKGEIRNSSRQELILQVTEELSIKVEKLEGLHALHIDIKTDEKISVFGSYTYNGADIKDGSLLTNDNLYIANYSNESYKVKVIVKIGDNVVLEKTSAEKLTPYSYFYFIDEDTQIKVTDDIYVEVSIVEE